MIEDEIIEPKIIQTKKNAYFMHYFAEKENINKQTEELKENNIELHKKLIKEGHNPNEIAKIIRNDEIEKLQEISSQTNFDFNQTIAPSLYERCSFINKENVTLIDYAAFFSSVKCFKYLLMNGSKVENAGKYAVAGGNEEIIHLCEQSHSTFDKAYETAIELHRNDIFRYLYENKLEKINKLEELGKKCVLHDNYNILSFLEKEGMQSDKLILIKSINNGNLFIFQYFLDKKSKPIKFSEISTFSGNKELFNYLIKHKYIDIKQNV